MIGLPLSTLEQISNTHSVTGELASDGTSYQEEGQHNERFGSPRGINNIIFPRRRMLYSRCGDGSKRAHTPGLGSSRTLIIKLNSFFSYPIVMLRLDLLSRLSSKDSNEQTIHVMKHIFPRQFGLRNVFATKGRLLDGNDIITSTHYCEGGGENNLKIPKRLRGQAMELTRKMRLLHFRCPYKELLQHYCPAEVSLPHSKPASFSS